MIRQWYFLLFLGIILISISVNMAYLLTQSIRLDEAQSLWVATKSVPTVLKISGQDVQTPLYALLLHFWLQITGATITNARALSLLFFLLTIPVLYYLIREASNTKTAVLGMLLFCLSPFVLWYGQEARTYSLLTFITAASHLLFLRFFRAEGLRYKFLYFLSAVVGIYTHYFFIFVLISQLVYLLRFGLRTKLLRLFLGILAGVGGVFIPWVWYVLQLGLAANTQPLIPAPTSYNLMQVYINFILGFQAQGIQSLVVSLWPLILIVLFVIFTRRIHIRLHQSDYFLLVSILPVILVYFASFYKPIFLPRYLILVVPSLFAVIAWLLMNLGKHIFSALSVVIILLMLVSLNYQSQSLYSPIKEDYRSLVTHVTGQATPQDIVVVSAPFTVYPIEYYYAGTARIDTIPQWDRFAQGPIPVFTQDALEIQVADYAKVYNRMFVVLSYNQGYQHEIVSYLDTHYQLLDTAQFPADIVLRVYQLRYDEPVL